MYKQYILQTRTRLNNQCQPETHRFLKAILSVTTLVFGMVFIIFFLDE